MRIRFTVILCFLVPVLVKAQEILKVENFLEQLALNHPVLKQANSRIGQAEAAVMSAKGSFDPTFSYDNQNKTLNGKDYYRYQTPELSWQTPFGLKLKAGQESSAGNYINPEKTNGRLQYFGFELPLLQGLLTDYKRTALKQARIFQQQNETDRESQLNDLLLEGLQTYNSWALTYNMLERIDVYKQNAQKRFELTKLGFDNGYYAAADTLEALGQMQNIELLYEYTKLDFQKISFALAQYLWNDAGQPYFPDGLMPENLRETLPLPKYELEELIELALKKHPDIRAYRLKIDYYESYRKLQAQNLLPEANLKYNYLKQNYAGSTLTNLGLNNNYKLGFSFRIPLFFRESRGDLNQTKLKLLETDWAMKQKTWEVETKVRNYHNAYNQLKSQTQRTLELQNSYKALLRNEEFKFKQGESSIFYVNTRENYWIEGQQKLLQSELKLYNALYQQEWAAGILVDRIK